MLLFHSASLPHYGLERVFEFAKKAGYDGLEIEVNGFFDSQNVKYLKKLSRRYKIPVKAFSLSEAKEEALTEVFQKTVREFVGSTINLNQPQVLSTNYKKWMEHIAPKLAQKYDLTLCRKNAPSKNMMGIIPLRKDNSLLSLKEKGAVCLDLTALASVNEDIIRATKALGSHLKHVYLSNVSRNKPYCLPQNGILPVESFLTKLARNRFIGNFSVRVDPVFLSEGDDRRVLQTMIEVRKFYEKYFVKELANEERYD